MIAGAALVVAFGALAVTELGSGSTSPQQDPSSPSSPAFAVHGASLRLAGFTFQLPTGFTPVASSCQTAPACVGPILPMAGSDPFAAAASARGGCIEAELAIGSCAVPANARMIQIGPYQGFLSTGASSRVDVYVEIPTASGDHDLILTSTRRTSADGVLI